MFLIMFGENFTEGYPKCFSKTKKEAESYLRKAGYHYNKRQDFFLNSNNDCGHWARIEDIEDISQVCFPKSDGSY
jgi:hypothetical protein